MCARARRVPIGPAQCDPRVGDGGGVSEVCMYAGTDGRLESIIPKLGFAPLYVNTRWWRRALRARRCPLDKTIYIHCPTNPSHCSRRRSCQCLRYVCRGADPWITLCRPLHARNVVCCRRRSDPACCARGGGGAGLEPPLEPSRWVPAPVGRSQPQPQP